MPSIQRRMSCFAQWIAPDPATTPDVRAHAKGVLSRLAAKAVEMDIPVVDSMIGGSFDKKTGLRRHMRGNNEIEGQDIDLVFVVDHDDDAEYFAELVSDFARVVKASYPSTEATPTKCSVQVEFSNPLVTYDVVPVYKTAKPNYQLIVRTDMERRLTAVKLHSEFIGTRITRSKSSPGVVEFNECIRLVKWWRDVFIGNKAYYLREVGVPSVLVELLFASVFDSVGVQKDYAATLSQWFETAAGIVRKRSPVFFSDYSSNQPGANPVGVNWQVLDPVNLENNISKKWTPQQLDEFSTALKTAADGINRAIRCDIFDDEVASLEELVGVFGTAVRNHCGDE